MQKQQRLRKARDFYEVRNKGRSWHSHSIVMLALRRKLEDGNPTRFGFVVSKRIGKAVVRNRYKRKMRSVVVSLKIKRGWDVICIVRRGQTETEINAVPDSMGNLLRRANLVIGESE